MEEPFTFCNKKPFSDEGLTTGEWKNTVLFEEPGGSMLTAEVGRNYKNSEVKKKTELIPPFSEKYVGSRVFVQKHNFQEEEFY